MFLENERVRLEPLQQQHVTTHWDVAKEKELWLYTTSRVHSQAQFEATAVRHLKKETNTSHIPLLCSIKWKTGMPAAPAMAILILEIKEPKLAGHGTTPICSEPALTVHVNFCCSGMASKNLEFNRIAFKTSLINKRSQQTIEKIGACKEGVFRKDTINEDEIERDTV